MVGYSLPGGIWWDIAPPLVVYGGMPPWWYMGGYASLGVYTGVYMPPWVYILVYSVYSTSIARCVRQLIPAHQPGFTSPVRKEIFLPSEYSLLPRGNPSKRTKKPATESTSA